MTEEQLAQAMMADAESAQQRIQKRDGTMPDNVGRSPSQVSGASRRRREAIRRFIEQSGQIRRDGLRKAFPRMARSTLTNDLTSLSRKGVIRRQYSEADGRTYWVAAVKQVGQ